MLIVLVPNDPSVSALVVYNDLAGANATGYYPMEDTDWGGATWDAAFSGRRAGLGPRASSGALGSRTVTLSLRIYGSTKDDLAAKVSALVGTLDRMRRLGGSIVYRANGQTFRQYLRVMTCALPAPTYGRRFEMAYELEMKPQFICAPYAESDPMEFYDDFSQDTLVAGLWAYETSYGAAGSLIASAGALQQVSPFNVERRVMAQHTGFGYGDVEVRAMTYWPGATNPSSLWYLYLKRLDNTNFVRVMIGDNAAVSLIGIEVISNNTVIQSTYPNLASRLGSTAGLQFVVLVGRIEGNVVTVEGWTSKRWSPAGTPDYTGTITLTSAMADKFGELATGSVGAGSLIQSAHAASYLDNFACEPYVYRRRAYPFPGVIRLAGPIPGDAPALMDVEVSTPSSVSNYIPWGAIGWSPRPRPYNMVMNGGFEANTIGWSTAAIAAWTSGSTSIVQVTTPLAKYGSGVGQFVTPGAGGGENIQCQLYRRFKKGQRYTATAWVRQTAGTATVLQILLGASNADNALLISGTLSTAWTQITATWTPTADYETVYVVIATSGVHAGTFQVDGVAVYEGPSIPASPPALTQHVEGLGASPPMGAFSVLSGLANVPTKLAPTAITAFSTTALYYVIPFPSAGSNDTVLFVIDPALVIPDAYTASGLEARGGRPLISGGNVIGQQAEAGVSEFDVEVYARLIVPGQNIPLSVLTYVIYGNSYRYTKEYGTSLKTIVPQGGSTYLFRRVKLGTFTMTTSPDQSRWVLTVVLYWGAGAVNGQGVGIDFLEFIPSRRHAKSPVGIRGAYSGANPTYPPFINNGGIYEASKLIRPDLSVEMAYPPSMLRAPDHGLNGAMIEVPPGLTDAQLSLSVTVPDDPGLAGADEVPTSQTASIRFSPRPRYSVLRPISG